MVRHLPRWSLLCCVATLGAACGAAETVNDAPPPTPQCPPLEEDALAAPAEPPDGPAACAPGACNYQTQEGCPDDQACRPQFNATDPEVQPGCEPTGAANAGDDCEAQSDCARGHYCAEGVCRKLCCGGDWTGCESGESCLRTLQVKAGGEIISASVQLCFPVGTCDPLDPRSCAEEPGRECKIVDPTGAVACVPKSAAGLGDACAPPDVCQQGLACVGGRCIKLCAFTACGEPSCGPEDGTCVHFARDPAGVGECTANR
jgi:hypothetical protein